MNELDVLEQIVEKQQRSYFGKFRAFVVDNIDPDKRGRLKLLIPSVLGLEASDWVLPCFPYGGGAGYGFAMVPPKESQVLVEFIEGDIASPVWVGTFWRTADEPPSNPDGDLPDVKYIRSQTGHALVMQDLEGEELLRLHSAKEADLEMPADGSLFLTDSTGATVRLDAEAEELHIADANGNSLVMSSSGMTATDANGNTISCEAAGITVKGTSVKIHGSSVELAGSGGEPLIKGSTFMAAFNSHTHNCTAPGSPSGPPVPPMNPGALSQKVTTA